MKQPNPNEFLVLPFVNQDLIAIFRGSDISRPLYVSYSNFVKAITATITPSNALLLQTNSVDNPTQSLLNLIQGTGITITDDGNGGITISNTGSGGTYTADNGLTENPSGNFQLGGTLLQDTTITNSIYDLIITGTPTTKGVDYSLQVISTAGNGGALLVNAFKQGIEVISGAAGMTIVSGTRALTTKGQLGIQHTLVDGSATSLISSFTKEFLSLAASNGDGLVIAFLLANPLTNPNSVAGQISSLYTDASLGRVKVALSAADQQGGGNIIFLEGHYDGSVVLPQYIGGAFSGTVAYLLAIDSAGKVIVTTPSGGTGTVTSVDLSMPSAFSVSGNPVTTSGTLAVTGAGTTSEYIRGDGSLATFPSIPTIVPNQNESTGILYGGDLSATIGGTTFNLAEGIGQIVSQTSSISGVSTTITPVTWSTSTGIAITNIATHQFTYILIDSSGTIVQQTTPFTDAQAKTHIMIGVLCHIDLASVNLVTNTQNVAYQDPYRLFELIKSFGVIKKNGLTISANGTNLSVDRTSGQVFKIGTNYITDEFQPDVTTMTSKTLSNLCRVYRNGSGGFVFDTNSGTYYTVIDPNNYDNGSGTLQSVGGSKWSIQRLFIFPNNPDDIICYYGIESYSTFAKARENLEIEVFDEATITQENAVFLGYLFVQNGATDLSDTAQALFLQSGSFRGIGVGGGGGGTSLSLETNGTPNGSQTLLNLVEGANMTITDDGLGNITFDAASGGGGNSTSLYVENTCPAGGLQQADICYVESSNAVFIANLSSNTVTVVDVTSNLILATIAVNPSVTSPNVIKYLPTINEVWVCGATNNLVRIDAAAFTYIAAVALGGIGYNMIEYDATKAYILTAAGYKQFTYGSMSITATIALNGAVSNSVNAVALNNNPSSAQYDRIIIGSRNGLQILNPTTNTVSTVDNLGGDFTDVYSYRLVYSDTEDAYYLATIYQSKFYKISITGATSFSQTSVVCNRTHDLVIDESVDTLLIIETLPAGTPIGVKNFKLSDLTIRKSEYAQIFGGASGLSGSLVIDTTRKKVYAVARNASSNGLSTLKYS